jgi:hypothetical protein
MPETNPVSERDRALFAEAQRVIQEGNEEALAELLFRDISSEMCPMCGQPDNCGDCDHTPIWSADTGASCGNACDSNCGCC